MKVIDLSILNGKDGTNGVDGINGTNGKSAYQSWLDLGNVGTESDFINSLKGENGLDGERSVFYRADGNVISDNTLLELGTDTNDNAFQWMISSPITIKKVVLSTGRWTPNTSITFEIRVVPITINGLAQEVDVNAGTLLAQFTVALGNNEYHHYKKIVTDLPVQSDTMLLVVYKSSTANRRRKLQIELIY